MDVAPNLTTTGGRNPEACSSHLAQLARSSHRSDQHPKWNGDRGEAATSKPQKGWLFCERRLPAAVIVTAPKRPFSWERWLWQRLPV